MPFAVLVHLCSTKVPYKTVGKEIIADRPEVAREILNGIREVTRELQRYLSRREHVERQVKRLSVFSKYLPKIADFSARLKGPDVSPPGIDKLYRRQAFFQEFRTTNGYVDSEMFDAKSFKIVLVHIKNKHESNTVNVKVLGLQGSEWKEVISERSLTAGSELYEALKGKNRLVKVQVKSAVADEEGVIDAFIDGLSE